MKEPLRCRPAGQFQRHEAGGEHLSLKFTVGVLCVQ